LGIGHEIFTTSTPISGNETSIINIFQYVDQASIGTSDKIKEPEM